MRDLRDALKKQLYTSPSWRGYFYGRPPEIVFVHTLAEAFESSLAMWYIKYELGLKDLFMPTIKGWDSDNDSAVCGLCRLFNPFTCAGCPIRAETDKRHCVGTPYIGWIKSDTVEQAQGAALAMYALLLELAERYCPGNDWVDWSKDETETRS